MLDVLTVDKGGDCPEMCFAGIKEGLTKSLSYSVIFVFTDADPKDAHLLEEISSLARSKQSQVSFLWTGFWERPISFKIYIKDLAYVK